MIKGPHAFFVDRYKSRHVYPNGFAQCAVSSDPIETQRFAETLRDGKLIRASQAEFSVA